MENYFIELNKIEGEVSKKQNLSYISWANAWDMLKRQHPNATYEKIRNSLDNSYLFKSGTGGMCEVSVTVNDITHCADLPVLDFRNQPVAYDKIDSFQINKTLQRAFTKALAMHWIGLYVYRWEDLPDQETDQPRIDPKAKFTKTQFKEVCNAYNEWWGIMAKEVVSDLKADYVIWDKEVEKITKIWKIYKDNQNVSETDINDVWKDIEGFIKEVQG